jgi:hypothetical protein
LDKEWHRLDPTGPELIQHAQSLPPQRFAGWCLAGTRATTKNPTPRFASGRGHTLDITRGGRKSDQAGLGEVANIDLEIVGGVRWIGRYNLQIVPGSERNQRVARADTGMGSACLCPDARPLLHLVDTPVEIRNGQQA